MIANKNTYFIYAGEKNYNETSQLQNELFEKIVEIKLENRKNPVPKTTPNFLIFVYHNHVYTLGKSGNKQHLLINENELQKKQIEFHHINRGGDITYHGPGQLIVYPILDLDNFFTDLHKYLRYLEEVIIQTLQVFGIEAGRIEGLTGVWVGVENLATARKICAMGVRTSRWITMHGLALNIDVDLQYFNFIVPCGIQNKAVTSMAKELGKPINKNEVEEEIKNQFEQIFKMNLKEWIND